MLRQKDKPLYFLTTARSMKHLSLSGFALFSEIKHTVQGFEVPRHESPKTKKSWQPLISRILH